MVRAAALLHDVGHYPFSHALEEIGALHHEDVARPLHHRRRSRFAYSSADSAPTHPSGVFDLIRGRSSSPLQGLISGSLDLDKIEYLKRDAFMCGVPYGEIDVDRLTNSLVSWTIRRRAGRSIGVREKGLSALESLLFAKYQMYRNVYWHHAVRSATAMYKRLVEDALACGRARRSASAWLHRRGPAAPARALAAEASAGFAADAAAVQARARVAGSQLDEGFGEWIATDRDRTREAEDRLAAELGLEPGEVLLDYPAKTEMLGLDIPVLRRGGEVERLTGEGWPGTINLPTLSQELYRSARWLRVFTSKRMDVPFDQVKDIMRDFSA